MLRGVFSVTPGYAGGEDSSPTYNKVSSGNTGHAEVIKIEYDSSVVTYETLLTAFFATHNPTTLNRQGNDVGTQYRSIILYTTEQQKEEAERLVEKLNAEGGKKIVTEMKKLEKFFPAEQYHTDYYKNNRQNPYCQLIIEPKVLKMQEKFAEYLKEEEIK